MHNIILRSSVFALLIIALFFTGLFCWPISGYAAIKKQTVTKYKFITAVVFIWFDGKEWSPAAEGGSYPKPTNSTINKNATNVKIYPYIKNGSPTIDLNDKSIEGNYYGDKDKYETAYMPYAASVSIPKESGYKVTSGKVNYTWKATLNSTKIYDVKEKLLKGEEQQIRDLCGDSPALKPFLKAFKTDPGEKIKGQLYFVPYVIQYDVEEEVEVEIPLELEATLNLPSQANVNEGYNAADVTILPEGAKFKSSTLEKNDGSGWTFVSAWDGSRLGSSVAEASDKEGPITYRLTVTLQSGESDTDTKTINIADETVVDATAILSLPPYTYEGHPVTAEDESTFVVDGENYSALRAYEEGKATNRFSIVESGAGSIHKNKGSDTKATAVFPNKGNYNVQLRVSPKNGGRVYDTKPIEVKKTPTVIASLSGIQKQNRKQVLNIQVAANPDNPLTQLWGEVTNLETGETVHLVNQLDGTENTLDNTEGIKTRPIEKLESNEYWTKCQLLFLTKNTRETKYQYKVYAKDSRGLWDEAEKEFTVQPDLPPDPKISVQDSFFREKGTNTAKIEMEDISSTDGDQLERSWYITEDSNVDEDFKGEKEEKAESKAGFTDSSFGTKKIIQVDKTGVGKIKIRLHVKDIWTEETLEEYITDSDYLTAETETTTKVINIAPIVSLKPITSRTVDILLLAGTNEEYFKLKNGINTMQSILLSHAIDADVKVKRLDQPLERDYPLYKFTVVQPFAYNGRDTSFENNSFLVDNHTLYTVEGTWHAGENYWNSSVSAPYTIKAFDADLEIPVERWSVSLYDTPQLTLSPGFRLAQDDSGRYLYFVCNGKTAIFTKDNGTLLTVLSFEVGESNFVNGDYIYTVKSNGIYAIHQRTGSVKAIVKGTISEKAKMLNGKVHFALVESVNLKRGILDLTTGMVQYESLGKANREGYHLKDIDSKGVMVFTGEDDTDYRRVTSEVRVYDRTNRLIKNFGVSLGSNENSITPVCDSNGVFHYIAWATRHRSKKYYHCGASLVGIYNGIEKSCDVRSRGELTKPHMLYTSELPTGEVYIVTGAEYECTDRGYGIYPARAKAFVYDPAKGEVYEKKNGLMGGIGYSDEYGVDSDGFTAVHCGDNNMDQASAQNSTTVIKRPRTLDQVVTSYLNRELEGSKTLRAVGLYNLSLVSANPLWNSEQVLKREGYDFYYMTDKDRNGFGEKMANRLGGTVLTTEKPAEDMAKSIIAKDQKESILEVKSNASTASFVKQTLLQTGKEYFYEYEMKSVSGTAITKDHFQSGLSLTPMISESSLTGERLNVADVVKESFDHELNPMFRFSSTEIYDAYDRWTQTGFIEKTSESGDKAYYPKGIGKFYGMRIYRDNGPVTATVSFTIPQGKKAALSFDYDLSTSHCNANKLTVAAELRVNGYTFKPYTDSETNYNDVEAKGRYVSPFLLSSGEQEISVTIEGYRRRGVYGYFVIDNLQLILIDESSDSETKPSINAKETGWSSVRGSFQTPGEIAYYGALKSGYSSDPNSFYYNGKTYVPAMQFNRYGNLGFTLAQGEAFQIRNLKVYYIENGKKVYAIDDTFNRESSLSGWNKNQVETKMVSTDSQKERESIVYKKGELVQYNIHYYDHENDPSKKQFWRYTHTPFNDGAHSDAATVLNDYGSVVSQNLNKVLNKPISRFYIDGKYTVEHWQEDNTNRLAPDYKTANPKGHPLYDKASNVESLTFYIEGGASAPWITSIKTIPKTVKEGKAFQIQVGVDDAEKDELRLTTEVYKEKKLIYTHRRTGIKSANGVYPLTTTDTVQKEAQCGAYEVVCTVRDQTGAGMGTYRFTVVSEGKITGMVYHTEKWDENRKKYNLKRFKDEVNKAISYSDYLKLKEPRRRGTNVFWSGEKFMLHADVAGSPTKVTCRIEGYPYTTIMKSTGKKNAQNETIYSGVLWENSMINKWGRKKPKELTFTFTAIYSGGMSKNHSVKVIVDSKEDYWQLHRLF